MEALIGLLVRKNLAAGEYFEKSGHVANEFCYVEKGLFRSLYRSERGDKFIKSFSHEGQVLGSFTSLLTQRPSELRIPVISTARSR